MIVHHLHTTWKQTTKDWAVIRILQFDSTVDSTIKRDDLEVCVYAMDGMLYIASHAANVRLPLPPKCKINCYKRMT